MATKKQEAKRLSEIKGRWGVEFPDNHREKVKTNGFVSLPARHVAEDFKFLLDRIELLEGRIEPAEPTDEGDEEAAE